MPDYMKTNEDFYGDDGLLHCGKCGQKKEYKVKIDSMNKEFTFRCMCKCEKDKYNEEESKAEYNRTMARLSLLKENSLIERKYYGVNFSSFCKTKDNENAFNIAQMYVNKFREMSRKNQGLIFWGNVGTGKSYTAVCIANELLSRMFSVVMTSFVKILQDIKGTSLNESEYIARLNEAQLLIIDDLGAERNTDFALEKVYNIIDSRYRLEKPLILTTNMSISEMKNNQDIRYKRIYDRVFEMCYPVEVNGKSWRKVEAANRYNEIKKIMEE